MNITIDLAKQLIDSFGTDSLELKYLDNVPVNITGEENQFRKGNVFDKEHYKVLKKYGIEDFEVYFTPKIKKCLTQLYPHKYRPASKVLKYNELDRIITAFNEINKKSKRKRFIISGKDIWDKDNIKVLLEYNNHISFEKWNEIKTKVDKDGNYPVRFSEHGILVLSDLKNQSDDEHYNIARKRAGLVSLLLNKEREYFPKGIISNDFFGDRDVFVVLEPHFLSIEYNKSNAKLVIVCEPITQDMKKAIAELNQVDKFVRLTIISEVDPSKKQDFFQKVKDAYNKDRWKLDDYVW